MLQVVCGSVILQHRLCQASGRQSQSKLSSEKLTWPETAASEKTSPGFLSMPRQLKHRQTDGYVFPGLKPQLQQNIQKYQSSPEEKASSVGHSQVDISITIEGHQTRLPQH